jgi:bifunctional DNA-binding transcriptional regulator/antitoxin component of YhaV-PrlF toxin-antitoxin module
MTSVARLTAKYQATIPREVRDALKLGKGDVIAFEIAEGQVKLRRAVPLDIAYAAAVAGTLGEWNSKADERAWRDL